MKHSCRQDGTKDNENDISRLLDHFQMKIEVNEKNLHLGVYSTLYLFKIKLCYFDHSAELGDKVKEKPSYGWSSQF